jgi:cytochrome c biogenesis protein CcmG/thiol:disulfide interchange protein DsbE
MKMTRTKWLGLVPLVLFVLLVGVLVAGLHGRHNASKFALHIGDLAPSVDLPLIDNSGAHFKTAAWRGRPYIVNFFASWCPDCRREHEELMTLSASHVPMIGVIFKDKPNHVAEWLDQQGNPYVAVAQDADGQAALDWGLTGVPETFIVDAHGAIRWHYVGSLTDDIVTDELMPAWENVMHGSSRG